MALACYPLALHFSFAKQNKNESIPTIRIKLFNLFTEPYIFQFIENSYI